MLPTSSTLLDSSTHLIDVSICDELLCWLDSLHGDPHMPQLKQSMLEISERWEQFLKDYLKKDWL